MWQTWVVSNRIWSCLSPLSCPIQGPPQCRSFRRVINIWGSRGAWYKQTTQHHNAPDALGPHHHLPVTWIYLHCWVWGQMFIITTHSKTNSQSSKKLESHIPYPNSIPFHKSSNLMSDCLTILQLSSRFTLPIALPSIIWQPHLRTCSKQAAASMHQIWTKPRWDTLSRGHVFSFIITSSWLRWEKSHFGFKRTLQCLLIEIDSLRALNSKL